tara:strand:- start:67 stop:939 length:873 start_codon:yes stop_codon:yes gene_type:complete
MAEEQPQGNPKAVDDAVFGSEGEDFFNALDDNVNGAIQDESVTPPETQTSQDPVEQVTPERAGGSNAEVDWEQRYKDSSKEAQKMYSTLKDLKPFVPVLDAMKQDSGLVTHVRDYLQNGGAPAKTVTESLGLKDDFVFDQQDAVQNPDSDSGKVMNAHIDGIVKKRVGELARAEQARAQAMQAKAAKSNELEAFRKKKGMSKEQFRGFLNKAQSRKLSLEDIDYLINKEQATTNTANSTKQDMLKQMKNVRNMPASASGANSQSDGEGSHEDKVFDKLLGMDTGIDKLFG